MSTTTDLVPALKQELKRAGMTYADLAGTLGVSDYFSGGFDGPAEGLLLVHGSINRALAPSLRGRLQRVAQDFVHRRQADQMLAPGDREGCTLLLAMRDGEFEAFTRLRR